MTLVQIFKDLIFFPFLVTFIIFFLTSFAKILGIRKLYVGIILRLFEYGRVKIDAVLPSNEPTYPSNESINLPELPSKPKHIR